MTGAALPRIEPYGPHPDQHTEWWSAAPDAPAGPRGTVVLLHGGYWRERFTASLMHPLVPSFTARGWTVANLEYRRGPGTWPEMRDDLASALAAVRSRALPSRCLALVGHSVGGQLALLAGEPGDAVVALAPVTDLIRGYREGIGDGAVAEFFGASPEEAPDTYASASPLAQAPPRAPTLIVHGTDDTRVPLSHTHAYVSAARAAAADVTLLELPSLPHLDAISPDAPHWPAVHDWLDERANR
ncbi:alpha/beta hydrolase [Herbiconiux sp. KACC 21604]|uniref:alpha/beta hydrolase family protein n=1 Tax=unclassified Herbiconiux TaxID=2618217 RepID=UPI001492C961|nr:alpha/beta hydrolase [Herbiconiux sp. SALV-R1]QJU52710.1 alpha/beta hydrolase [Herbiconiux sp. SALV-R1]WPO87609.1 alpha/beta hydrolase [Herbiconiux sp. KACC 21604]